MVNGNFSLMLETVTLPDNNFAHDYPADAIPKEGINLCCFPARDVYSII